MAASLTLFSKLGKLPKTTCQHAPIMILGFTDAIRTQANNKDNYSIAHVIY